MRNTSSTLSRILRGLALVLFGVLIGTVPLWASSCRVGGITTPPIVCSTGQNAWNNFHFPHGGLNPVVINESSWPVDIAGWNAMGSPVRLRPAGVGFEISVKEGGDANSGWLGLASVRVNALGHIISAKVTMNRVLLDRYPDVVAWHVLAQEIGHLAGLDHQRGADDSSMEDCVGRRDWYKCITNPAATGYNAHDLEQLRDIYAHVTGEDPPTANCSTDTTVLIHAFPIEGATYHHD